MSKDFVDSGNTLTFVAAGDLVSGQVLVVGDTLGFVNDDYLTGEDAIMCIVGKHDALMASADVIGVGDDLYWNGTEFELDFTANRFAGKAALVSAGGSTVGMITLVPNEAT